MLRPLIIALTLAIDIYRDGGGVFVRVTLLD